MALDAQGDQVLSTIHPAVASESLVVDLKVITMAAVLASPSVSSQHLQAEGFV
jgi:hypothetical protein